MEGASRFDDYLSQARAILEDLVSFLPSRPFAVRLPDGAVIPAEKRGKPAFTLVLRDPSRLRRMLLPPSELALGESYIFGAVDIEGDIVAAFRYIDRLSWPRLSLGQLARLAWKLWRLERNGRDWPGAVYDTSSGFSAFVGEGQRQTVARDQQASQFHYDLPSRFYRLWLDERMVYSCAYFAAADDSLEAAQRRKLDRVCQKLDIGPGERFLDIGCGFGALVIHAAAEYGAQATGISLSQAQTDEARRRIEATGLADRCAVEICHYEEFEPQAPFDKLASVGMVGHVAEEKLVDYFAKAYQLLKPGGRFILQGGAARTDRRHAGRRWMERLGLGRNAFTHKYSFPDTRLNNIALILEAAERVGFEVRDIESLREHYPLTLKRWLARLEQNRQRAVREVGETAYRSWRLVLAGFLHLLDIGQLTEYQTLLAKPAADGRVKLPLVRRV